MEDSDTVARRRAAVAAIFGDVATHMVERVVSEAVRASRSFGLSGDVAQRYGQGIRDALPPAIDALVEIDPAERERKMELLVANVRRVSDDHHVPRIIERGLVGIAFGYARGLILERAGRSGFSREELDAEFMAFRSDFEKALFRAS